MRLAENKIILTRAFAFCTALYMSATMLIVQKTGDNLRKTQVKQQ